MIISRHIGHCFFFVSATIIRRCIYVHSSRTLAFEWKILTFSCIIVITSIATDSRTVRPHQNGEYCKFNQQHGNGELKIALSFGAFACFVFVHRSQWSNEWPTNSSSIK